MDQQITDLIADFSLEQDIVKRAGILKQLQQIYNVPLVSIAKQTGLKPSHISHILRINRLSPLIIDGYYSQSISATHLFVIARLKDPEKATAVFEKVLTDNLSVGATEIIVREVLNDIHDTGEHLKKEEVDAFIRKMNGAGLDATVVQTRSKAKITLTVKGNLEKTSQILSDFMNGEERKEVPTSEVLSVADL